jgi:hypothetical protein
LITGLKPCGHETSSRVTEELAALQVQSLNQYPYSLEHHSAALAEQKKACIRTKGTVLSNCPASYRVNCLGKLGVANPSWGRQLITSSSPTPYEQAVG